MTSSRDPGDDELVTLSEACDIFFGGRLTKSSLRVEASRGNLAIVRIANKDFVTRRGINDMIARCTIEPAKKRQEPDRPSSYLALKAHLSAKAARARHKQLKSDLSTKDKR